MRDAYRCRKTNKNESLLKESAVGLHTPRLTRSAVPEKRQYELVDQPKQVQNALNLALKLKNRAQMPALLSAIDANKDNVHHALSSLHYVHFARFLPTPDFSKLSHPTMATSSLT
jgi:hypothetical protein